MENRSSDNEERSRSSSVDEDDMGALHISLDEEAPPLSPASERASVTTPTGPISVEPMPPTPEGPSSRNSATLEGIQPSPPRPPRIPGPSVRHPRIPIRRAPTNIARVRPFNYRPTGGISRRPSQTFHPPNTHLFRDNFPNATSRNPHNTYTTEDSWAEPPRLSSPRMYSLEEELPHMQMPLSYHPSSMTQSVHRFTGGSSMGTRANYGHVQGPERSTHFAPYLGPSLGNYGATSYAIGMPSSQYPPIRLSYPFRDTPVEEPRGSSSSLEAPTYPMGPSQRWTGPTMNIRQTTPARAETPFYAPRVSASNPEGPTYQGPSREIRRVAPANVETPFYAPRASASNPEGPTYQGASSAGPSREIRRVAPANVETPFYAPRVSASNPEGPTYQGASSAGPSRKIRRVAPTNVETPIDAPRGSPSNPEGPTHQRASSAGPSKKIRREAPANVEVESTQDLTLQSRGADFQSSDTQNTNSNVLDVSTQRPSISEQSGSSENQFDCFGRSVAAQLRSLPHLDALDAQWGIQEFLSEMSIRDYRRRNNSAPLQSVVLADTDDDYESSEN